MAKEEVVEVKKVDLDRLFSTIDQQSKDIEMLYKVADKARLAQVRQSDEVKSLIHTCKISKWDNGKIITGWKLTQNKSEIVNGRWVEDQRVAMFFEDGTLEEVTLLDFYRRRTNVVGEITGRTSKMSGGVEETMLKIHFPDGKELSVGQQFIN